MTAFGYTLVCEQRDPRDLVSDAVAAEGAGFDFEVISDHYFPWLDEMGHSPYAWSVLGAVATVTERVGLMTYVTCPTMRYHPAVVAQKAATIGVMSDGRFTLGLGAGENLNEHVVGRGWPSVAVRHQMLAEAVPIIRRLLGGGYVTHDGKYFRVDSAKLWDRPVEGVPIAVAVSGERSVERFAPISDAMVGIEPAADLVTGFMTAAGASLPAVGQQLLSWGPDAHAAAVRARELFRFVVFPPPVSAVWKVLAELPSTAGFATASQFVGVEDVAEALPCGPDVAAHVEAVRPFVDAGYTHVSLLQTGGETQPDFLGFARSELLPALREEYGEEKDPAIGVRLR
jgi:G6PDH family F420-dependent oxidoreductase